MQIAFYAFVTIATTCLMEFVAWFAHKYVMHGLLWNWHEDHHKPHPESGGFFEKNDLFFLVFAIPSALSYILGSATPQTWLFFVGVGISIYGVIYFLIHDVYIHRRFPWFRQLDSRYSRAILRAHGSHHARQTKEDCESFGLLWVHPKYFRSRREWRGEKGKAEKNVPS
ncbi:MAG: sterol desaturase family protein [Saprospiraceae bacterium]|nr:sterol desaturase family protein [Saprospiraceae bacterium]MCB0624731.1 sterol desaturase family protein [Saprospiraceae bacterium]MCB0677278.1 sterol desaturase family protein [Saprospiraceae bacterium]MCB0679809.1 sterol desaturase family protein [Saprospiraceae bacterium]